MRRSPPIPRFATNVARVERRADTDARVAAVFGATDEAALTQKLAAAEIAFARVNDPADLAVHPQLRRIELATPSGPVAIPPRPGAGPASRAATARYPRSATTAPPSAPSFCRRRSGRVGSIARLSPHAEERTAGVRLEAWACRPSFETPASGPSSG